MYKTNRTVKNLVTLLSICLIGYLALTLSSCGGSSPTPVVVRPGLWEQIANFSGVGRSGAASFVIDNKAYVGGGFDAEGRRLNDWWQFDPVKNGWIKKTDFSGPARSSAVAFVIDGKGYVGTGIGATTNRLKDFWEFDPTGNSGAGSWRQVKDFGDPITETGRYGCVAFTVGNRGFVAAGFTGSASNELWEYLPSTNTWQLRTGLSAKRVNATAFTIGNTAYVVGGFNAGLGRYIINVEQYDPATDTWTQKQALDQRDASGNRVEEPNSREFASSFTIGGFGYIVGGSANNSLLADTWQYNPDTDTWTQYFSLEGNRNQLYSGPPRDAAVGFGINGLGYIATGRNGNFRLEDALKFDPSGVQP
jgi:N-acetylneuraminic acid mutarotase